MVMELKVNRETVMRTVSVILRVPALFIAEAWYRTDLNHVKSMQIHYAQKVQIQERMDQHTHDLLVQAIYYSAILLAMMLILLPLKKLVNFYMYIVSAGLLIIAHYLSFLFVETEKQIGTHDILLEDTACIQRIGINLATQCIIGAIIAYLINLRQWTKLTLLIYSAPMVARMFGYPVSDLHKVHNFASVFAILLVVFYIFHHIPIVLDILKSGINKVNIAVQFYGWIPFFVALWFKIMLPVQFLVFWTALFALQLYKYYSVDNHPIFAEGWLVVLLASIGECCVTPVSLIGVCVTISYISYIILSMARFYLVGRDAFVHDNVMQRGWTEGFTMFLLAVQTGIIELKSTQRAFLMSIMLFIVISSLIQSMYELTEPILLSLSASQNKNIWKHLRAIALCTCLWIFPLYMTVIITQFFELDFWLMVVLSSCVLTSVQVIGTLVVYALFIYDSLQENSWERLDDVVYFAKATTRVLEFIVAVFVVCYGVKESLLGEWSWVNSSILILHCYFNVWQRLQAGWKSYLLRRDAVEKIESLPMATEAQLKALDDVCSICFQELTTARITPCNHFFHALCLRKWLYVEEHCPLCHQNINLKARAPPGEEIRSPPQQPPAREAGGSQQHQDIGSRTESPSQQEEQSNSSSNMPAPQQCDKDGNADTVPVVVE